MSRCFRSPGPFRSPGLFFIRSFNGLRAINIYMSARRTSIGDSVEFENDLSFDLSTVTHYAFPRMYAVQGARCRQGGICSGTTRLPNNNLNQASWTKWTIYWRDFDFFLVQKTRRRRKKCCYREAARLRSKSHCGEMKFNQSMKIKQLKLRHWVCAKRRLLKRI